MKSPARQHFQKTMAALNGVDTSERTADQLNQYELMLMQLASHKRTLKEIQSREKKALVKADFLPEYTAYVDGVIESNIGVQDDVLMTVIVWRIDAGDLEGALEIGEYALHHNLVTPEQYNRDTATLLTEEIAEYIIAKGEDSDDFELALKTELQVKQKDMPDQVRAKLHKALGMSCGSKNYDLAIDHLQRAIELDDKSGVKKIMEKFVRESKNNKST